MLITFDLDGVLIKNPFEKGVFPEFFRIIGIEEQSQKDKIVSHIRREQEQRIRSGKLVDAYDWDDMMNLAAAAFGYHETIDVESLVQMFCKDGYIWLYPNVKQFFQTLPSEVECKVLTNGFYKYQYPVLKALQIDRYFTEFVTPDKCGFAKPQQQYFHYALSETSQDDRTLNIHVGDTLVHDVIGANRAGFISVWVCNEMPDWMLGLRPWQRTDHPYFDDYAATFAAKEEHSAHYPMNGADELRPNYVVSGMTELRQCVENLITKDK